MPRTATPIGIDEERPASAPKRTTRTVPGSGTYFDQPMTPAKTASTTTMTGILHSAAAVNAVRNSDWHFAQRCVGPLKLRPLCSDVTPASPHIGQRLESAVGSAM
jgi:hypothetical protein